MYYMQAGLGHVVLLCMFRRVGRGVSSLPGNPLLRLFCGCGSSPGARTRVHSHATRTRSVRMPIIPVLTVFFSN